MNFLAIAAIYKFERKRTALEGLEVQAVTGHEVLFTIIIANTLDVAGVDILCVTVGVVVRRMRVDASARLFDLGRHCR